MIYASGLFKTTLFRLYLSGSDLDNHFHYNLIKLRYWKACLSLLIAKDKIGKLTLRNA